MERLSRPHLNKHIFSQGESTAKVKETPPQPGSSRLGPSGELDRVVQGLVPGQFSTLDAVRKDKQARGLSEEKMETRNYAKRVTRIRLNPNTKERWEYGRRRKKTLQGGRR